jgi:hypothetical protein
MWRKGGFWTVPTIPAVLVALGLAVSLAQAGRAVVGGELDGGSPLAEATTTTSLFTYLGTEQVTPDGNYLGGGFVRIYDSPTTGRLLVTFNTPLNQPEGSCSDSAHAYKEYTTDLQETGTKGLISCMGGVDIGSLLVGSTYYLVTMHREGEQQGWQIATYDAASWTKLVEVFRPVDYPREVDNDPMVAYVNGQIDVSSQYNASGTSPDLMTGAASFHLFFSADLQFLGEKILADTPHEHGSSMLFLNGVYYFVSASAYLGDLVVMKYDANWNYLGVKSLKTDAFFSEGLVYDGQRFYVAYMDTSQRTGPASLPVSLNVRLAAFDRDWNLVEDIPVTSFTWADLRQPGRPYLLLHGDRLYVSYDCDTIDPDTHQEQLKGKGYVAMYEVAALKPHTVRRHLRRQGASCPGPLSPLGVLRSTDHGATWTSLGNACLNGSTIEAVDPTAIAVNGSIALYALDMATLTNDHSTTTERVIYRATTVDGVNFGTPQPAFTQYHDMVDPSIVRMPNGSFRMYVPVDQEGIISASSSDGLVFTREDGVRTSNGGMPGALLLPDNRVRLFLAGGNEGQEGIYSMISSDGLNFTTEGGVRIPSPVDSITDNPQPIRLANGSFLMLYQIHEKKYEGLPPWQHTEIHLATSTDALNWTTNPTIIGYGGTSCVIEAADGTMYLYYGGP